MLIYKTFIFLISLVQLAMVFSYLLFSVIFHKEKLKMLVISMILPFFFIWCNASFKYV